MGSAAGVSADFLGAGVTLASTKENWKGRLCRVPLAVSDYETTICMASAGCTGEQKNFRSPVDRAAEQFFHAPSTGPTIFFLMRGDACESAKLGKIEFFGDHR